jgi:hypothetical protein
VHDKALKKLLNYNTLLSLILVFTTFLGIANRNGNPLLFLSAFEWLLIIILSFPGFLLLFNLLKKHFYHKSLRQAAKKIIRTYQLLLISTLLLYLVATFIFSQFENQASGLLFWLSLIAMITTGLNSLCTLWMHAEINRFYKIAIDRAAKEHNKSVDLVRHANQVIEEFKKTLH